MTDKIYTRSLVSKDDYKNDRCSTLFRHIVWLVFVLLMAACKDVEAPIKSTGWDSQNYGVLEVIDVFVTDPQGYVWAAVVDRKKDSLDDFIIKPLNCSLCQSIHLPNPSFNRDAISGISFDKSGQFWVVTPEDGLLYRQDLNGKWHDYPTQYNSTSGHITWADLVVDELGQVWVSPLGSEMYSLDPSTGKKTPSGLEDARNLTIDNQGQVWATTTEWLNTNIMILKDGKWEKTAQRKGEINALVISDQSRVWVRYKSGVSVLGSNGNWTDYPYDPTMYDGTYPLINSRNFDVDMRGRVWTGTQWGLYMLDPDSGWVKYNVTDSGLVRSDTELTENQVHDLIIDNAQRLWISLEKTDGRGNPSGNMVGILDSTVTP